MRKQLNAAERKKLDILHRTEAMYSAPSGRSTKEGNLNRLKDGILSSRLLSTRERQHFYLLVTRLEDDYPPNMEVDRLQIRLVAFLFLQIGRALTAGNYAVAEILDSSFRGHLHLLNATKLAREGHQPMSSIGSPESWVQQLLDSASSKPTVAPGATHISPPTETAYIPYNLENPGTF